MKNWTEEDVKKKLESNPYYNTFLNEYDGGFSCIYDIEGVGVAIFNHIGGTHVGVYFTGVLSFNCDLASAQQFVFICYKYLNQLIKNKNSEE